MKNDIKSFSKVCLEMYTFTIILNVSMHLLCYNFSDSVKFKTGTVPVPSLPVSTQTINNVRYGTVRFSIDFKVFEPVFADSLTRNVHAPRTNAHEQ